MIKYFTLLTLFLVLFASAQETPKNTDITAIKDYNVLKTRIDLTDVHTSADVAPQFPGGLDAFRKRYMELFTTNLDEKSGTLLQSTAYFIIEKDGKMSNVTAIGHKRLSTEAEKALKKIKTNWKPAMIDGEPVRFMFSYPLNMNF